MEPLTPAVAADLLRASAASVAAEVRALPPDLARRPAAEGGWCALEVVGHLIEAERRGFAGRIRLLLAEDPTPMKTWDQPSVAAGRHDCERDPEALIQELLEQRQESVRLVRTLTSADLERAGEHPMVGRLTIADVLHEWVHHDRAHLKQVVELTQAFAWPHMGNAWRFSQPG